MSHVLPMSTSTPQTPSTSHTSSTPRTPAVPDVSTMADITYCSFVVPEIIANQDIADKLSITVTASELPQLTCCVVERAHSSSFLPQRSDMLMEPLSPWEHHYYKW